MNTDRQLDYIVAKKGKNKNRAFAMTADCLRLRSTCTEVQTVRSRLETARKLDNIECVDDSLYFRDKKASLFA